RLLRSRGSRQEIPRRRSVDKNGSFRQCCLATASLEGATNMAEFLGVGQPGRRLFNAPAQPSLDNLIDFGTRRLSLATEVSMMSIWGRSTSASKRDRINHMPHCSPAFPDGALKYTGPLKRTGLAPLWAIDTVAKPAAGFGR